MYITEVFSGDRIEVDILPIEDEDFKVIAKRKRFPTFKWKLEKGNIVFKLQMVGSDNILGLISLIYFKEEKFIKINLIQSSKENVGNKKLYDRIAGCLISYACRLSFVAGYGGCVALQPKTVIAKHYIDKYQFKIGGKNLYIELVDAENLIEEYLNN
ncbi:MAG: N-acetyltransferase [Bacteroidia bacterium]|nr:N-acetyltransferase [Bacteroidia bacterium]